MIFGKKMRSGIERIGHLAGRIHLGAVAGRQDRGFVAGAIGRAYAANRLDALKPAARRHHRLTNLVRRKGDLFAQRNGCGGVVEADG